jgi:hypothetical protein
LDPRDPETPETAGQDVVSPSGTEIALLYRVRRPFAASLIVLAVVCRLPAARAAEPEPEARPYVAAFELGLIDSPHHQTYGGPDGGVSAPPGYAGVVLDARVRPHFHLDGQFGLNFVQGWMGSLSARLAAEVSALTVSIGAGPLVASGGASEPGVFADADVSAILHFDGPFVILFRAGAAWAVRGEGRATCGTDTCDPYLARGDRITFARLGLGTSF